MNQYSNHQHRTGRVCAKRATHLARILVTCAFALIASSATADSNERSWTVNGFGTLGVVHSDQDQADFAAGYLARDGAGFSDRWSPKVDSKAGIQLTWEPAPKFKAVLQVISEQDHKGSFNPRVEWANLSYGLTPELTIRAGRTVLPVFMSSDYRKVGYALPTVRPEVELYDLVPISNSDGVDINYQTRIDSVINSLRLFVGQKSTKLPHGFEVNAHDILTLANTMEWQDATLFASYSQARLSEGVIAPLFDGFRAFGPEGQRIADRYDLNGTTIRITSLGGRYDPGDWFVNGEWAANRSPSFIGDNRAWYLTAGIRLGSLTPYLTVADRRARGERSHPGLAFPQAEPLNMFLNDLLAGNAADQRRMAAGLRWDLRPGLALKTQLDRIELRRGSRGMLSNVQHGFDGDKPVHLLSATFDFVF